MRTGSPEGKIKCDEKTEKYFYCRSNYFYKVDGVHKQSFPKGHSAFEAGLLEMFFVLIAALISCS